MASADAHATVKVAATQMACSLDTEENLRNAEALVREAHAQGAQIILLQELFAGLYFCQEQDPKYYDWAHEIENNPVIQRFAPIARELQVVLPISFFERANNAYYNSIAMIDVTGEIVGVYRKSHIPDGPGYQEKFYFTPGDTGFMVFRTAYATIGVGICWDQWFPECARAMALLGADLLLYPTAIGSEPQDGSLNSRDHWQRVMMGHSAANMVPVVASNRVGTEHFQNPVSQITFYGSSFITDNTGKKLQDAGETERAILVHEFDFHALRRTRAAWGMFRDRRPELYGALLTKDGRTPFGTPAKLT